MATESFISAHLPSGTDPGSRTERERAAERASSRAGTANWPAPWAEAYRAFNKLRALRNALAHGSRPAWKEIDDLLDDEKKLQLTLGTWLAKVRACAGVTPPAEPGNL